MRHYRYRLSRGIPTNVYYHLEEMEIHDFTTVLTKYWTSVNILHYRPYTTIRLQQYRHGAGISFKLYNFGTQACF